MSLQTDEPLHAGSLLKGAASLLGARQLAYTRALLWANGTVVGLLLVLLPHGRGFHPVPWIVIGVLSVAGAIGVLVDRRPKSMAYFRVAYLIGISFCTLGTWAAGSMGIALAPFACLLAMNTVLLFGWSEGLIFGALTGAGFVIGIIAGPQGEALTVQVVVSLVTSAIIIFVVGSLLDSIRALAEKQAATAVENAKLAAAAEAAAAAKGSFLATMSHEIRTPMNAVIGMTELLLRTDLTKDQRELADMVSGSGEMLLTLINEVLDFSKIEAGELELEQRPHVIAEWTESAVDVVAALASSKGLELVTLIEPTVPAAIVGDDTRLRQVLINLMSNAIKFTHAGEIVVTVDARPLESAPAGEPAGEARWHELHLTVTDTGVGIPADRLEAIFTSFSQADSSTTRQFGGTGLGLTISQRLIELMGGRIWVESEVGVGSTFHVTFPAAEAVTPAPPHALADGSSMRDLGVLIVDDTYANRELLRRLTTSWSMRPVVVDGAAEALALLDAGQHFDLALLDLMMPEVDGLTLARDIQARAEDDGPVLVLLSSLVHRPEPADAKLFAATLTKPLKASQLFDTLISAMDDGSTDAQGPDRDAHGVLTPPAGLRTLIVEDNLINQKLATRVLNGFGYEPDIAENGQEALDALEAASYDVILMDIEMPVMDGLEAMRRIVARHGENRPRMVAMTANAFVADREACFEAGADDYVSKPIRIPALAEALSRCTPKAATAPVAALAVTATDPLVADVADPAEADGLAEAVAVADDPVPETDPDAADSADALDPAAIARLQETAGDDAFAAELIEDFVGQAEDAVALLLGHDDDDTIRRTAHTLKSGAATFGAVTLAELCGALEAGAHEGTYPAELPSDIGREFERVRPLLTSTAKALQA